MDGNGGYGLKWILVTSQIFPKLFLKQFKHDARPNDSNLF